MTTTVQDTKDLNVEGVDNATVTDPRIVSLPYGKSINLIDSIVAANETFNKINVAKYGLKFKFDLKDGATGDNIVYNRGSNNTDQEQFIDLTDMTLGTVKAKVFTQSQIAAAQGRTPIVHVVMYSDKCDKIAEAYVKIIIADKPAPATISLPVITPDNVRFACNDWVAEITVKQMNENLYNPLDMSKTDFHTAYSNVIKTTMKDKNGNYIVLTKNNDKENKDFNEIRGIDDYD